MSRQSWRWFAVVGMMVVTFFFGTDTFSSENTRPIIRWVMRLFFGSGPESEATGGGEGFLRKTAHFTEYGLLAFVWYRALRGDSPQRWKWSWAATAFTVTVFWASI